MVTWTAMILQPIGGPLGWIFFFFFKLVEVGYHNLWLWYTLMSFDSRDNIILYREWESFKVLLQLIIGDKKENCWGCWYCCFEDENCSDTAFYWEWDLLRLTTQHIGCYMVKVDTELHVTLSQMSREPLLIFAQDATAGWIALNGRQHLSPMQSIPLPNLSINSGVTFRCFP